MNKLPQITLAFWIMKICATTLGETAGDLLSMTLNVGYALSSILLLGVFLVALTLQLRSKTYHPLLFWMVILATSTAGTTISDYMDRTLELGYPLGASILLTLLIGILLLWRSRTGSISVTKIKTPQAEYFYWAAILCSNTLGTAMGDFLADSSGLGFAGGAVLIGSAIGLCIAAYYWTKISHTVLFWAAFVLTRPFGATIGDFMTKPVEKGGLDWGTIGASAVLAAILLVTIAWTSRREKSAAGTPA